MNLSEIWNKLEQNEANLLKLDGDSLDNAVKMQKIYERKLLKTFFIETKQEHLIDEITELYPAMKDFIKRYIERKFI